MNFYHLAFATETRSIPFHFGKFLMQCSARSNLKLKQSCIFGFRSFKLKIFTSGMMTNCISAFEYFADCLKMVVENGRKIQVFVSPGSHSRGNSAPWFTLKEEFSPSFFFFHPQEKFFTPLRPRGCVG